ncbi:MAG: ribosomal protein, partial [Proteobacteria bacterium]|nr:ribosomal protein [Pseudomonadota bacterium]
GVNHFREAAGALMNAKDLRKKTPVELREELIKLRREQFNLRMAAAAGQPARPDQYGKVRKNLARVKTVLSELERASGAGSEG